MQRKYHAPIKQPKTTEQTTLFRNLGEFSNWMKRPKDQAELLKDRRKPVPPTMLPMPF
ncbi:hypothetical protein [Chryseobacterium artocarpi]|uniref:hypothetical protein n=1 Tax=Chryseobacterium artocarpi TaxID=1414727 RepID=UPI0013F4F688|nr:hypothetical protein [Chryseobacterium artocarpi]